MDSHGGVLIMTLVFVTMFVVIFSALTGLITRSYHEAILQSQDEAAFQIAEAGLNYGRWRLAHQSTNYSSETRTVSDQFAGTLGSYTLSFIPPVSGSTTVLITAQGRTVGQPNRPVTVQARYGTSSLARYLAITNSDVWYSGQLKGTVHANGGIRMDGQSKSLLTSAKATYVCQPVHACNNETKPGIWGQGGDSDLWQFPVPPVDYTKITVDLLTMKSAAQNLSTYYGPSGSFGYEIVFNTNNTYTISRVTRKTNPVYSYFAETGYEWLSHDIANKTAIETKPVPSGGIIFVEDTLWIKGDIRNRITVAAGRFPDTPSTNVDIIINGDLSYGGTKDGSRILGVVAQRHVLLPWSGAPESLTIDGAFIAQKGRFGRRYYPNCCGSQAHRLKANLNQYGMIASNLVPVTTWVDAQNRVISGYRQGEKTYDPNLLYMPPPYFPTDGQYEFISWEQL